MKTPTPFPVAFLEIGFLGVAVISIAGGLIATALLHLECDQIFNVAEGVFWICIAVVFARKSAKKTEFRKLQIGAAITFLLFGISDFIEVCTKGWFTPWSLLALKAACVLSLVLHLRAYLKIRRRQANERIPHVK